MNFEDYFYYDETSSTCLRWKVQRGTKIKQGMEQGSSSKGNRYYQVGLFGKYYKVHRIIWEILEGAIPEGVEIDHKDTNARNNTRSNLRLATKGQNRANRKMSSATGYRGVYQVGPSFKQQIKQGGTVVYLGVHDTQELQAVQYDKQAKEYFGEFQVLNFPSCA